jgi:hypothetical protein
MTTNSLGASPFTPCPDPPCHSGEAATPPAAQAPQEPADQPGSPAPAHSSSDDLSLLLVQSSPDPFLSATAVDQRGDTGSAGASANEADAAGPRASDPSASDRGAMQAPGLKKLVIDGGEPLTPAALQSSSEHGLDLDIRFSPSPDVTRQAPAPARGTRPRGTAIETVKGEGEARINWPLLLTASYASAVTLALAWVLWSGRGLARRVSVAPPEPSPSASRDSKGQRRDVEPERAYETPPPLPAPNLTELGRPIRLGDLEVTPRWIVHRAVELTRLEGTTGEQRESPSSLVLTLQLTNRSPGLSLTPLDPDFVRESSAAIDHSYIETAGGPWIGMFRLAPESEWSLQDQVFPHLKPGESAETIVVSEPVLYDVPKGVLTWHVKLRTRPYQTDVVGIQFRASDVEDWR